MYQQAATLRKQAQTLRLGRLTTVLLLAITAAGLPACDEQDPTGTDLTTSSEGAQVSAPAGGDGDSPALAPSTASTAAVSTLALPINQSKATSGVLFGLTQTGTGPAGYFKVNNVNNTKDAILGQSNGGLGSAAVRGLFTGSGGFAGFFESTGGSRPAFAVVARHNGIAAEFDVLNPNNGTDVLRATSFGVGAAGRFESKSSDATVVAINTGTGFAGRFKGVGASAKGVLIETSPGVAGLQVVGGSKNAVVRTPAGAKALYTEESTEVWFTDYGFGKLANGRVRVRLDPSFAQTINPDEPYHVFLQVRGNAELYVGETTPLGFEVSLRAGDPNAEFSYRIVAKRLGFERKRLEPAPWADHLPAQD